MKKFFIQVVFVVLWGIVGFVIPDPAVSLVFPAGEKAEVRQLTNELGHLQLEVRPKEMAAKFSAMTIAGLPVFSREWLVANVASTVPLGESEIIDFPRFFELLPKLLFLGRLFFAVLPLCVLLFLLFLRYGVAALKCRCGRRTFFVALFLSTLFSFPEPIVDYAPGLDPSWSWFLNHFAFRNIFGSEVVFTYGPLGFLLCPQGSWSCVLCALAANILFAFLWIRLLLSLYRQADNGRTTAWLLIASTLIPVTMEWRWTLLAVLYVALPRMMMKDNKEVLLGWGIAGMLAAVIGLMKFSSLTIVIVSHVFCFVVFLFKGRGELLKPLFTYTIVLIVSFVILSVMCFSSLGAWVAWIRGSLATASGYNLYMIVEKPWFELFIPVVIGVLCLYTIGWRHCFLFAPILFLTAKYAWVRQSSGPMAYAVALLAIVCLLDGRRSVRRVVSVVVIALALNVTLTIPFVMSGLADLQSISGIRPLAFCHTVLLPKTVRLSLMRSMNAVAGRELPSQWRSRIGAGGIAFLPHEYAPAMADGTLNIKPLPSLQLYSACHPYLDERNAVFFEERIPDFVVCNISAKCSGHFINYPRMWMALLENYKCVGVNDDLVLMARGERRRNKPDPVITLSSALSFGAKLRGTFLRNPVEYVTLTSVRSEEECFQFVRGNQGVAFPLGWIPFDDVDMCTILRGGRGRCTTVRNNDGKKD